MANENFLDSLHAKARRNRILQYFAVFNRLILAVSFFPSGMTKLLGYRFSLLSLEYPPGYFFDAFYRTGGWYRFVGFFQVLAAILLLFPRTATLGAAIFFSDSLKYCADHHIRGFSGNLDHYFFDVSGKSLSDLLGL